MKRQSDFVFLFVIILLALGLRLDFLIANHFVIDSDEAIVGLMAKHILEGKSLPVFYYGQHYMGSLEALVTTIFFFVGGISSVVLKCVPLFFSLILVILIYFLTKQCGDRRAAKLAALFTALPPSALVVWSSMARGGFIEIVVIGAMVFLLTAHWLKSAKQSTSLTFLIGLALGFGWWVNNQILYFMLVVIVVMGIELYLKRREQVFAKHFFSGIGGFCMGSLPFWWYNFTHEFASFSIFSGAGIKDILSHFLGAIQVSLPILLGAKRFWYEDDIFSYASLFVLVLYGGLLLSILFRQWQGSFFPFSLKINKKAPIEILILLVLFSIIIFSLSSYGHLYQAPRYLLPVYVSIFILSGIAIDNIWKSSPLIGKGLCGLVLVLNICSSYLNGRAIPGEPFVYGEERAEKDHGDLIKWLNDRHYAWIKTNYWIGYRLAFETKEKIKFLVFQKPFQVRIPKYEEEGKQYNSSLLPLVLVPSQGKIVASALEALGYTFKLTSISGYSVIHEIMPIEVGLVPISSNELSIITTHKSEGTSLALDANINTRWGSGVPQSKDMKFEVIFPKPRKLRGLRYDLGNWLHDFPRGLEILLENAEGEKRYLCTKEDWDSILYYQEGKSFYNFFFHPIEVTKLSILQTGDHAFLDWSIAELSFFE